MNSNQWYFRAILAAAFCAPVCWAQESEKVPGACTMEGTWYGGGPLTKYLSTIIANRGGNYTMTGYAGFSQKALGIPVTTTFSNAIVKGKGGAWEFFGIGMINKSDGFPAPTPEVWAIHGTARLTDCNTLRLEYDFFGAYLLPTDKKPFLDPPDYVIVPPPFTEVYERMPLSCTQCLG